MAAQQNGRFDQARRCVVTAQTVNMATDHEVNMMTAMPPVMAVSPYANMAAIGGNNMALTLHTNLRLPRGGWLQNPFAELAYHRKEDVVNLIRFLESFKNMARYEGVHEANKLHYFGRSLKGTASTFSLQRS